MKKTTLRMMISSLEPPRGPKNNKTRKKLTRSPKLLKLMPTKATQMKGPLNSKEEMETVEVATTVMKDVAVREATIVTTDVAVREATTVMKDVAVREATTEDHERTTNRKKVSNADIKREVVDREEITTVEVATRARNLRESDSIRITLTKTPTTASFTATIPISL
jgi:vacuolar-type H+-ATPase subunit I/STV1